MVHSCCAYGCKNKYKKGSGIHFFKFPMEKPDLLDKWKKAVRRKNWEPTVHTKICSDHFVEKDFQVRPGAAKLLLRETSVPSVFPFSTYKKTKKKSSIKKASFVDIPKTEDVQCTPDLMLVQDSDSAEECSTVKSISNDFQKSPKPQKSSTLKMKYDQLLKDYEEYKNNSEMRISRLEKMLEEQNEGYNERLRRALSDFMSETEIDLLMFLRKQKLEYS